MKQSLIYLLSITYLIILSSCSSKKNTNSSDWCDNEIRSELTQLKEIKVNSSWFKVYEVGNEVYAIIEPYNYQEVISYLILGTEKAILFDTGMGFDSISKTVKEITKLPITVINSHSHYDHIGGNHEFNNIMSLNTNFTLNASKNGVDHEFLKPELAKSALCYNMLPTTIDTTNYKIYPYKISNFIKDGQIIDIGQRKIEIISIPGHTPDAIALLDNESGYLWSGDTFYEGGIYLFSDGTNLNQYSESTKKLANVSSNLKKVFPAHNSPISNPGRLIELENSFSQVLAGTRKAEEKEAEEILDSENKNMVLTFKFDNFSFKIRKEFIEEYWTRTSILEK